MPAEKGKTSGLLSPLASNVLHPACPATLDAPCRSRISLKRYGTLVKPSFSSHLSFSSSCKLASSRDTSQPRAMSPRIVRRLRSPRILVQRDLQGAFSDIRSPISWTTRNVSSVDCCRARAVLYASPWRNTRDVMAAIHPRVSTRGGSLCTRTM